MEEQTIAPDTRSAALTEQIIERFGGIRPMAAKLDVPVTTVQGWKKRGAIPAARHPDILAAAARGGIDLDPAELALTDPGGPLTRTDSRPADIEREPRAEPPPRRRSFVAGLALALSLATLLGSAGGAAALWHFYLQPLEGHTAALEARVAQIEPLKDLPGRVASLETAAAMRPTEPAGAAPAAGPGNDALAQDVAQLKADSARYDQLAKRLADMQVATGGHDLLAQSIRDIQSTVAANQGEVEHLTTTLQATSARVDRLETALAERRRQGLRAEAVVLAVGQLRAALRTPKPFAEEVTALKAVASDDRQIAGAIDEVEPFAATGVPTLDDLRSDFSRLAPEIVRSEVVGDGSSWWNQALYRIQSVISVRRTGSAVPGDRADALVARAEAKLDEDDLAAATAALHGLSGLPAETAAAWLQQAEQRETVDAAEAELSRLAIARVAADNPEGPPAAATPPPSGDPPPDRIR